jgi:hypothetical protein
MGVSTIDAGAWWLTVCPDYRVLMMVPTMTSMKRMLDIAGLFEGDLRVQLSFTVPPNALGDGTAVLLGAYRAAAVHPDSGAAALAAIAPRLVGSIPVIEQLSQAAEQFDAEAMARVAALISSEPGGFARHTRSLLYGMLGLGQPAVPARLADASAPRSPRESAARSMTGKGRGTPERAV